MLGSQINALDTSTSYSTPYPLANQTPSRQNTTDQGQRSVFSQDENQDQVILNPDSIAKLESFRGKENSDLSEVRPDGKELSKEDQEKIAELEDRDREVRRHEQAHFQAAGNFASPPQYEYQTGPDGKRYAIGGSVEIDTSAVNDDPEATLNKARVIKRAALAPEEPSAQDRKVARQADKMAAEAQKEIAEERISESKERASGEPAVENAPDSTEEGKINAPESVKSPSQTLEFSNAEVNQGGISQYKMSRLDMDAGSFYRVERLATPSKAQLYSPSMPGLDMYA